MISSVFFSTAFEDVLRLLAPAHQDDAFDRVVVLLLLGLETENTEARRVADDHAADVLDADGDAIQAGDNDFADVFRVFYEAEAPHVVELPALRVKAAARIGIVGVERRNNLNDRQVIVVKLHGIEQDVILHRWPAKTGVVRHTGHTLVRALNDPIFVGMQLHRRAIRAFDDVAVDETTGAEERGHARRDTLRQRGFADALEHNLAREIRIHAFIEGQAKVR